MFNYVHIITPKLNLVIYIYNLVIQLLLFTNIISIIIG